MVNERLCNIVRSKYKSDAAFGLSIGWTPQKTCKLMNGKYIPKIGEAADICRALGISLDELASFFAQ